MKFDAEFLKKNIFWVLLVVTLPLVAVACVVLGPSVGGLIAQEEKKVTDELKSLQLLKEVKTEGDVDTAKERAKKAKDQETVVWKEAYVGKPGQLGQKDLMAWPDEFENHFRYQNGNFAREIDAERKPKAAAPADSVAETITPDVYQLHKITGVIEDTQPDWIEVKVDKTQAPAGSLRIYNTKRVKVTLATEKDLAPKAVFFNSLKPGDRVTVKYEVGKYFGDSLTPNEIDKYKDSYKTQIAPLLKQVDPINTKGEGLVELGDWLFSDKELPRPADKFLTFVPAEWTPDPENHKEFWMAQEDLWVQKELYRLVAQANDYVAKFEELKGSGGKDRKFINPYWELTTNFDKTNRALKLTMKNRLPQTQAANINFRIKVSKKPDEPPFEFAVQGGSLTGNTARSWTKTLPETTEDILEIRQVLTWENAAVKRIEQVSLGSGKRPTGGLEGPGAGAGGFPGNQPGAAGLSAKSNRTFPKELLSFFKLKKADAGADPAPGSGIGAKGKAEESLSKNGFDYKRYIEVTPQARRLPVGMVLIIDQNHLTRVLTSFSNSNLRFLTTQVLLNRYPKNISPLKPSAKTPGAGGFPGGFGSPYGPGYGGKFMPQPTGPTGSDQTGSGQADTSEHLEVVIYGTVSLYERFPARPPGSGEEAEGS